MFRRILAVAATVALTYVIVPAARGDRIIRVYGDLRTAERVAVIVPGTDTTAATFDGGRVRPYITRGGRRAGVCWPRPGCWSRGQAGGGRLARL